MGGGDFTTDGGHAADEGGWPHDGSDEAVVDDDDDDVDGEGELGVDDNDEED